MGFRLTKIGDLDGSWTA